MQAMRGLVGEAAGADPAVAVGVISSCKAERKIPHHTACRALGCPSRGSTSGGIVRRQCVLHGLPGNRPRRPGPDTPPLADLVNRGFTRKARDSCGSGTSPNTPRRKAKCTARSCRTPSLAG